MKLNFNEFVGMKKITKTLSFKIIPQGATNTFIEEAIYNDNERAKAYPMVKELIDDIYREIIDSALSYENIKDMDGLIFSELAFELRGNNKNTGDLAKNNQNKIDEISKKITKKLSGIINKDPRMKEVKGKNFIDLILKSCELSESERETLLKFKNFTVYFTGFHENRANVFDTEDKSTSIYNRIVNENFPLFINGLFVIDKIVKQNPEIVYKVEDELKKEQCISNGENLKEDYLNIDKYIKFINQKGIDKFNKIRGEFNKQINLHNQQNKEGIKYKPIPKLKKQILSDKGPKKIIVIEKDEELLEVINHAYGLYNSDIFERVKKLFEGLNSNEYEEKQIYIPISFLRLLSQKKYKDQGYAIDKIKERLIEQKTEESKKNITKKALKEVNDSLGLNESGESQQRKDKYFSFEEINKLVDDIEDLDFNLQNEVKSNLNFIYDETIDRTEEFKNKFKNIDVNNVKDADNVEVYREALNKVQYLLKFIKYFNVKSNVNIDTNFYGELEDIRDTLELNTNLLNLIRNYVTKADYSKEKIKLKFDIPTLADGWSQSKEESNKSIFLMKNGLYYLGIIKSGENIAFGNIGTSDDNYEKMNYYLLPGPNKMLPKCMFTNEVKEHFKNENTDYKLFTKKFENPFMVTKEFFDVYQKEYDGKKKFQTEYRKKIGDVEGYRKALKIAIDGCKDFLEKYTSTKIFDYSSLKPTEEYKDISEFYKDVELASFKMEMAPVDAHEIDRLVKEGKLLLFQIYSKDFSPHSKGKDNLFTIYLKSLFSHENIKSKNLRLAGNAELFFRKKSVKAPFVHKKGVKVINKTYEENGVIKNIPGEYVKEINDYFSGNVNELSREAKAYLENKNVVVKESYYDIVKDRRFTVDQFEFHFPVIFNSNIVEENIDEKLQEEIKHKECNIIGIDRGERNLLYVSVINSKGEILEQKSLNIINGIDYHAKLDAREKERTESRRTWTTIKGIKNIKEGYVSQAVHAIVELAIKHDAIIAMENLNYGFKQSRIKFEKQIYQKFENMLASKLSFLVFKDKQLNQEGSTLAAYQLAQGDRDLKKINRNGIIFYVPAAYTSVLDIKTGFVNIFRLGGIKNQKQIYEFIRNFDSIKYDLDTDSFIFDFDYSKFETQFQISKSKWSVYTKGDRIKTRMKNRVPIREYIDLTVEMKTILDNNGIKYKSGKDILADIMENKDVCESTFYIFKQAINLRNSDEENDYILSPILKNGKFYDTREAVENTPLDADANGAYNIALKALYAIERYRKNQNKEESIKTHVKHQEWIDFVVDRSGR